MTANIKDTQQEQVDNKTWIVDTGPGSIPLYISQDWDETKSVIEKSGIQIAYVLLNLESSTTTHTTGSSTTTSKIDGKATLCKYISLPVGAVIAPVTNHVPALGKAKSVMTYHLPPIPWVLLDEVDAGFRAVDAKLHTEAIVVLTFDMEYFGAENASDGWGFIVPKQKNSSVKCNYEHDSIIHDLPDDPHEVIVVGSIHSHPNMSAYASHTDEGDQIGFDGLHITIGWQKSSNNNASQYHIELQIGTQKTQMKPENVFEAKADVEIDEDAHKPFFDRVTKFSQYDAYKNSSEYSVGGFVGGKYNNSKGNTSSKIVSIGSSKLNLPSSCPKPDEEHAVIVKLLSPTEMNCPCCNIVLTEAALAGGRCTNFECRVYLLKTGETPDMLARRREQAHLPYESIDRNSKPKNKIIIWRRNMLNGKVENIVELHYQPEIGADSKKA